MYYRTKDFLSENCKAKIDLYLGMEFQWVYVWHINYSWQILDANQDYEDLVKDYDLKRQKILCGYS